MQKDFVDIFAFVVKVFDFFSSDVFTLLKFEDVFLSINDFKTSGFSQKLPNIASFEPSVFCQSLFGLCIVFIVTHKNSISSEPDLTSWRWSSLFILISAEILHLWDVCELEFERYL